MNKKAVGLFSKIGELVSGVWRYNFVSRFRPLTPRSLMINLTYKCNSRCIMCNIWRINPKKEMRMEDWEKVTKDPIFKGIKNLTISGGEGFLYKDYSKAVGLFLNSMPNLKRVILNSNGFLGRIVEEEVKKVAVLCREKKISLIVSISVDGVGPVHNEIRGIKGGFDLVRTTIGRLRKISKKYQFKVVIASLLLRNNIDKFKETKKWLDSTKLDYSFQIVGFHKTFVNNLEQKEKIGFNEKVKNELFKVLNYLGRRRSPGDLNSYYWNDIKRMYRDGSSRTTPCPFLKDDFVIDSFGDVYYCLSTKPIGNTLKENRGVSEIYFDTKNLELRGSFEKNVCLNCNSGCNVYYSLAYDLKHYLWFLLSGKLTRAKNRF